MVTDFRAETIYFLVTDRFCDGDPANNTGKNQDYDPERRSWWLYWGGDLQGVMDRLDYLQALGATAIWLTPVFDQFDGVIVAGGERMAPYHGYWARDFKRLDEHLVEDPADVRVFARGDTVFDRLVAALHGRGMKLILDVVCNHGSPHGGGGRGELFDDGRLIASFDADQGGWYHHLGDVQNWEDLGQVQTRDLCGLADFDEESQEFRDYIKGAMRQWLDKGVDAFRVDTVKHMPLWFWQEFTEDMRAHRPELFMFGEWFLGGCYDPASVDFASRSGMTILDFSWRTALVAALAQGSARGFEEVAAVVAQDPSFRDPTELVTFVDNHDLPRFLSLADDRERFRVAVLLTMLSRGTPCLYYGGEQWLHCDTNGGNDPYNRSMMPGFDSNPFCADIAAAAGLRRRSPAVQKGGTRTKWLDPDRWVFTRKYQDAACLVGANRAGAPAALRVRGLELPDGEWPDLWGGPPLATRAGEAEVLIPARGIVAYSHVGQQPGGLVLVDIQVYGIGTEWGEEVLVVGNAPELGGWNVRRGVVLEHINAACWAGTVAFDASAGREIGYKFAVRRGGRYRREPGRVHHRRVPESGTHVWRDDWRA